MYIVYIFYNMIYKNYTVKFFLKNTVYNYLFIYIYFYQHELRVSICHSPTFNIVRVLFIETGKVSC